MQKSEFRYTPFAVALLFTLPSCQKDYISQKTDTPTVYQKGIYILNQGSGYGSTIAYNSSLTYYNYSPKILIPDLYNAVNRTQIGAIGNDAAIYGSKMYIVASISSVVDIVDAQTGKLIKQDSIIATNYVVSPPLYSHLKEPRNIAFYKGNAYISSYDGTVAILDTTSLSITNYITVGSYPENLVVANDKLYVANSGAGRSNTVSVIDLTKQIEIKKISVIPYPVTMAADDFGNIYAMSAVDYISDSISFGGMTIIDSKTDLVKSQPVVSVGFHVPITVQGNFVYFFTLENKLAVYDAKTQTFVTGSFITDGSIVVSPMAITVSPLTGEVFIGDGKDNVSNGNLYA